MSAPTDQHTNEEPPRTTARWGPPPSREQRPYSREERSTIINGMLCIVLTLVLMQLWLLTATMNAFLAGDSSIVWPAAFASLVCFGLIAGLIVYLHRLDQ